MRNIWWRLFIITATTLLTAFLFDYFENSKMNENAQKFFLKKKDIIVWVASYNEKAINFYEKLGFIKTDKDMSSEVYEIYPGKYIPQIEMVIKRS